jgi:phosphoglycolate phosphatase-like HAD superfamily hydrolase
MLCRSWRLNGKVILVNEAIRMVGMDFDLTLVDYKDYRPVIPLETQALLHGLAQRGIPVGLVSGRVWWDARDRIDWASMNWGWGFPSFFIARETFIYWARDGVMQPDVEWNRDRAADMEQLMRGLCARTPDWLDALAEAGIPAVRWVHWSSYGLELQFSTSEDAEHARGLLTQWMDLPLGRVHSNRSLAHVVLATGGKSRSLVRAAETLGLKPSQVLAIGDARNDLDMLDGHSGIRPAAVSNAQEPIKDAVRRAGGWVASQPAGLGVAEILRAVFGDQVASA